MALLSCFECGQNVSDKAAACPHCGAPVDAAARTAETAPEKKTDVPPGADFHLFQQGQQSGPFTLDQLRKKYLARQINDQTLYARRGMRDWWPVKTIFDELFPRSLETQPAPPPPIIESNVSAPAPPPSEATPPSWATPTDQGSSTAKAVGAGCLLLCALVFLIPAISYLTETPSEAAARDTKNAESEAHYAAEQFIKKQFPGATKISGLRDSVVEKEGNTFRVAVSVDGVNAFGGPIRTMVAVEMKRTPSGGWELVALKQK